MSYLTETRTSSRNYTLIGVAVLIHLLLGYALVTGLAYKAIKKIVEPIETVNIKEPPKPVEKPPPPPEKLVDIPVVTPPPIVTVENQPPPPPQITTVVTTQAPRAEPTVSYAPPPPVVTAPPAPTPKVPARGVSFRGDPHKWFSDEDYPESARRANEEGTTAATLQVDERGRITGCEVTRQSGSKALDDLTCRLAVRRGRANPAIGQDGQPMASTITLPPIRWVLPKE